MKKILLALLFISSLAYSQTTIMRYQPPGTTTWVSYTVSDSVGVGTVTNSTTPIKIKSFATGSLPTAASYPYNLAYDLTTSQLKFSNGTIWQPLGGFTGGTTALPSLTGNSGKFLTTDGTSVSWGAVSGGSLPTQTGNNGKFLTTDGSTASWGIPGSVLSVSVTTANGVSGSVATATSTPAITLTLGAITPTTITPTSTITTAAGTSSIAPINIPASVVRSTPASGDIMRNADGVFISNVSSTESGLIPSSMTAMVPAGDFALSNALGVQSAFPTDRDVWTLPASSGYFVEGVYIINKVATNTTTVAIAFALAGGASITSLNLYVDCFNAAANTTGSVQATTYVNQVASTVINATGTTQFVCVKFWGNLQMNAGGTITPQINFSAAPGSGTNAMKAGSFIKFTKLGSNTASLIGAVN